MKDDDLDLELEEEEPWRALRASSQGSPAAPSREKQTSSAATTSVHPARETAAEPVGPRRRWLPGWAAPSRLFRFRWTWRNFLLLLIVLIVLVVFVENWIPVRFYLLGFAFEIPRTVMFLVDMALGALLMWLWQRRAQRGREEDS